MTHPSQRGCSAPGFSPDLLRIRQVGKAFSAETAFITVLVILICLIPAACEAQSDQPKDQNDLSKEVETLKQTIEAAEDVKSEVKDEANSLLKQVAANQKKSAEFKRQEAERSASIDSMEESSQAILSEISEMKDAETHSVDLSMSMADIEKATTAQRLVVSKLQAKLQQLELDNSQRITRKKEQRAVIEAASKTIDSNAGKIKQFDIKENSIADQARRLLLESELKLAEAQHAALVAEQLLWEAEESAGVLRHRRDLLNLQLGRQGQYLERLEASLATKRLQAAQQAAAKAAKEESRAETRYPLLVASYEINTQLAKRIEEVEDLAAGEKQASESLKSSFKELTRIIDETQTRVEAIGRSGSVGAMLRKRKSELPDFRKNYADAEETKQRIDDVQFEIFEREERFKELSIEKIHQEIIARNGPPSKADLASLEDPINELIATRKRNLESVIGSLNRRFNSLLDIETYDRRLAGLTEEFRDYINERILWIRSNEILFSEFQLDDSDRILISPTGWTDALRRIWKAILNSSFGYCLAFLAVAILLGLKPRLQHRLDALGEQAARGSCATFWPTSRAFLLTIIVAAPFPLLLMVIGYGIRDVSTTNPLFVALSPALRAAAWFLLPMEIFRRGCREGGLARQHFDWSQISVSGLRTELRWSVWPGTVLVFVVTLMLHIDPSHRVDLIERSLFLLAMLLSGTFLYRLLNPGGGVFHRFLKTNDLSWATQTSSLWFGLIMLLPVSLAFLAVWGFYYTALNLSECMFATFVFAVAAEFVRGFVKRFVLVRRRNAHIQTAKQKKEAALQAKRETQRLRAEQQAEAAAEAGTTVPPVEPIAPVSPEVLAEIQPILDIEVNAKQANNLVNLGIMALWAVALWMIWIDVLPALKALDDYTVWPADVAAAVASNSSKAAVSKNGNGKEESSSESSAPTPLSAAPPSSNDGTETRNQASRVTVRDILVFLFIALLTLVSARNLPNTVEMLFLEQLPVDRSARYATKALFSYAIILLGSIFAFRALSITWSNVQWLATALTFGLAFGLQEIFANFVAGIILMFERPVRIGDWITVDEFTGVVTRIRTRATTIVNRDRKEFVIPNKDFITGRLVNWTLSDAINRIEINVGIAYGSDVKLAKQILHDICMNHPRTVKDPPTYVSFEAFGDNSLNLVARTFIADVASRVVVMDELHTEIDTQFREANIEISFPQRDLHVRSIDGGLLDSLRSGDANQPK